MVHSFFYCPEPSFPDVNCGPGTYTNSNGTCEDCPVGTYQPGWSNGKGLYICKYCDEGKSCKSPGLATPSESYALGFYCPIRSTKRTEKICLVNHYCPAGAVAPIPCPPGTTSKAGSTAVAECTGELYKLVLLVPLIIINIIILRFSNLMNPCSKPNWAPSGPQLGWQLGPSWAAQLGPVKNGHWASVGAHAG